MNIINNNNYGRKRLFTVPSAPFRLRDFFPANLPRVCVCVSVTGTWMTLMLSPVSCASCSRMCLVGLGVAAKAAFNVSSCLALMVVRGPRRFPPRFWSSFSLLPVSLSDSAAMSASFSATSSCSGSGASGDRLGSLQAATDVKRKPLAAVTRHPFTDSCEFARVRAVRDDVTEVNCDLPPARHGGE